MSYPKHIVAVGVLVKKNGRNQFLLVKTGQRGWELPGGQIEEGEDIVSGLKREVKEEAGANITIEKLAAIYSSASEPCKVILDFIAKYDGGEGKIQATDEIFDIGWFSEEELIPRVQNEVMKYRVRWLLGNHDRTRLATYVKNPFKVLSEVILKEKSAV